MGKQFSSNYIPGGPAILFQGTNEKLQNYLRKNPNCSVVGGSNGSWNIARRPEIQIFNNLTGQLLPNPRQVIMNLYPCLRVTQKKVNQLVDDLNSGKISWDSIFKT